MTVPKEIEVNIQKMMKQAQEMQAKLGQMQSEMEAKEFEGQSGSGAVKITLTWAAR